MLSFSTSVSVNNILALRAFYTFLFNYQLHEKPYFWERLLIPYLKKWVERRAISTMNELLNDTTAKGASVSLNDVSGDFFAVLYIVQNPDLVVSIATGHDLFQLFAQMALEFEKVRKPRVDTGYAQQG